LTPANRKSGSHARCSKAVPTYALRIIAADIVLLRATRSQLIPPRATSDFVVSAASRRRHDVKKTIQSADERSHAQPTHLLLGSARVTGPSALATASTTRVARNPQLPPEYAGAQAGYTVLHGLTSAPTTLGPTSAAANRAARGPCGFHHRIGLTNVGQPEAELGLGLDPCVADLMKSRGYGRARAPRVLGRTIREVGGTGYLPSANLRPATGSLVAAKPGRGVRAQ